MAVSHPRHGRGGTEGPGPTPSPCGRPTAAGCGQTGFAGWCQEGRGQRATLLVLSVGPRNQPFAVSHCVRRDSLDSPGPWAGEAGLVCENSPGGPGTTHPSAWELSVSWDPASHGSKGTEIRAAFHQGLRGKNNCFQEEPAWSRAANEAGGRRPRLISSVLRLSGSAIKETASSKLLC